MSARPTQITFWLRWDRGETVQEVVKYLPARGEEVGLLKVRLYRPFRSKGWFITPRHNACAGSLGPTKEPGARRAAYQDIMTARRTFSSGAAPFKVLPRVIGGRYGLSSKEFTPAMVLGILGEMRKKQPRNHFMVGIVDDVTGTSLEFDRQFLPKGRMSSGRSFTALERRHSRRRQEFHQDHRGGDDELRSGLFRLRFRKAGTVTVSHLRFGPKPIYSSYLIEEPTSWPAINSGSSNATISSGMPGPGQPSC